MKLRVLIVEDNKWQLAATKYFLLGVVQEREIDADLEEPDIAHCASEARDLLIKAVNNSQPYDILFLDLGLPEQQGDPEPANPKLGLEILKLAREKQAAVSIIVISFYRDYQQLVAPTVEYGATQMIIKPYEPELLIHAILRSLKNASTQIFFNYAVQDKGRVAALYSKLADEGFTLWMDVKNLLPGEVREFSIGKALQDASFVLIFLSANYVNYRGHWHSVKKNAVELFENTLRDDIYLIPVLLEDCDVPEDLQKFQPAKIYEEGEWEKLVQAIREGVKRRHPTGR
ncbi:MAG: TIR domain-containing protein [Blastocatellia bacterium]